MSTPRTLGEIRALYELPLPELMFRAQQVHRENNDPNDIELCALESVKTGGVLGGLFLLRPECPPPRTGARRAFQVR